MPRKDTFRSFLAYAIAFIIIAAMFCLMGMGLVYAYKLAFG
jgi:hypothetical protein